MYLGLIPKLLKGCGVLNSAFCELNVAEKGAEIIPAILKFKLMFVCYKKGSLFDFMFIAEYEVACTPTPPDTLMMSFFENDSKSCAIAGIAVTRNAEINKKWHFIRSTMLEFWALKNECTLLKILNKF